MRTIAGTDAHEDGPMKTDPKNVAMRNFPQHNNCTAGLSENMIIVMFFVLNSEHTRIVNYYLPAPPEQFGGENK